MLTADLAVGIVLAVVFAVLMYCAQGSEMEF